MYKSKTFTFFGVFIVSMMAGMTSSKASLLQLSHDPLFLNQTVPPAIAVTLDDSGSMAWGYMFRGSFTNWNQFADPTFNRIYYNPNITYTPPIKADGSQMPNIDYTNAPVNGYYNYGHGKWFSRNLSNNFRPLYTTSYYSNNTIGGSWAGWISAATNGGQGTRAFYLRRNNNGTYTEVKLTSAADLTNFANWYSYYSTRMKLARASISRAFAGFGPSFKIDWQNLWDDTNLNDLSKFENSHRSDFYEWLFKSPTSGGTPLRNAFKRAGRLFEDSNSYDSEDFNTKLSCQQNFHIAVSDGEWNGGFSNPAGFRHDNQSLGHLPGDTGTTTEPGAKYGGYNGADEQVIYPYSGDNNSLADIAFHYWAKDLVPSLNNNVKRFKKDYTDASGTAITVPPGDDEWDVEAFVWNPKNNPAYWQHVVTYNVGMGLESPRVIQQMSGGAACVDNNLSDPKAAVYRALRLGNCTWSSDKIDDVWHSSINSRGDFFSANDPEELIKALNNVVNDILERLSRGSTSTVSSGVITNDTLAYSPGFDSSKWSGNLIAREVNGDGSFGDAKWDAACVLTGGFCAATGENVTKQLARRVYTFNDSQGLVSFDTGMPAALKTELANHASELLSRTGASLNDLINYVIGEQEKEISNGGVLRNRVSVLSDVVHGSPSVVRGPNAAFKDIDWPIGTDEQIAAENGNGYLDYQIAKQSRHNVLYFGSNSGMLHAFDAEDPTTTEEYWSFIPSKAFDNIHRLADPQFKHWSYVDNTPIVRDAFINNNWRTVLINGMRYGGQAFFALDVTQGPSTTPEVLWEFTDEDDPDMGYSYGQATIARISSTGDWVALLPNGYNNTQTWTEDPSDPNDNNVSGSGNAVLFVVRLSDGKLLAKLNTGEGSPTNPNGLATAVAIDSIYADKTGGVGVGRDQGADYAYAGDLYGNLWRFDFTSPNYSDWSSSITRVVKASNIKHRPITTRPQVVSIPRNFRSSQKDVMVMFGTGKYIEIPDRSINLPADQYMVGVMDGLTSPNIDLNITDNDFVEQSFSTNGGIRTLSEYSVDLMSKKGWRVELPEQGERLANPMTLLANQVLIAPTTVTAGIDPCEAGGRSWISAFNPLTGGTPNVGNIFRLKNGNVIEPGTGLLINDLIIGGVNVLKDRLGEIFIPVEGSGASSIDPIVMKGYNWRRRNWTNLLTE
jgi:type IV pilus assembly protein PilY1